MPSTVEPRNGGGFTATRFVPYRARTPRPNRSCIRSGGPRPESPARDHAYRSQSMRHSGGPQPSIRCACRAPHGSMSSIARPDGDQRPATRGELALGDSSTASSRSATTACPAIWTCRPIVPVESQNATFGIVSISRALRVHSSEVNRRSLPRRLSRTVSRPGRPPSRRDECRPSRLGSRPPRFVPQRQ